MIPTLTKEEIFSYKDINTIKTTRNLDDTDFDTLIAQLNIDAVGYCKGMIIQRYHEFIDEASWRNIIKLYTQWQAMTQAYSEVLQILATNSYNQLITLIQQMNSNFALMAQNQMTPNKIKNFNVINR